MFPLVPERFSAFSGCGWAAWQLGSCEENVRGVICELLGWQEPL